MGAWESIYEDYLDSMKDNERGYVMKLASEINVMQTRINVVKLIITRFKYAGFSPEIYAELQKHIIVAGGWNKAEPEKSLKRIETLAKTLDRQLASKIAEYDRVTPAKEGGPKTDRDAFVSLIIHVAKYMGFMINRHHTPMAEFVGMLVNLRDHYSSQKRKDATKNAK